MKNTEYNIKAIDLIALQEACYENKTEYFILDNGVVVDLSKPLSKNAIFVFEKSRYTMDTNGFHIGYETYHGKLPIFNKRDLGIDMGIPSSIFPYIVLPNMLAIEMVDHPEEDEMYYPAEDDFIYQEMEYLLKELLERLPEAEFGQDKETGSRYWDCGYFKQSF